MAWYKDERTPNINKIPEELRSHITDAVMVNYFVETIKLGRKIIEQFSA